MCQLYYSQYEEFLNKKSFSVKLSFSVVGYEGIHCENEIDECKSNPCQNHGICEDQVNKYKCTCRQGM